MRNLIHEEREHEWFEIEQVCFECGRDFIADYAYNKLCPSCRFKDLHDTEVKSNDPQK